MAETTATVYCRPSTKNVVTAIADERDDAEHAPRACAGILIGSRAQLLPRQRRAEAQIREQDHDPDEQHAGNCRAVQRQEGLARRVDRQQNRDRHSGAGHGHRAQRHAGRLTAASQPVRSPDRDSENSIRVVRYRFEFALDSAAEITTRFITPAAYGMPTAVNARTKGLPVMPRPPSAIWCHGVIISITPIAST